MKTPVLVIGALALLGIGSALAQLSCGRGAVGVLACEDREVKALVRQIGVEVKRLRCVQAERNELKTVERAWGRRQYKCIYSADVRACVMRILQSEIDYLQGMERCELASRPVKFETPDPSYVIAHSDVFIGSEVSVMGALTLADCTPGATSVVGKVHEYKNESAALEIRFKSLPDAERNFLCTRRPFSEWRGTVKLTDKRLPYLYSTEVLGTPLP
jgi:hypothetical protein